MKYSAIKINFLFKKATLFYITLYIYIIFIIQIVTEREKDQPIKVVFVDKIHICSNP